MWQLVHDDLPDRFPPLRTLDQFRHDQPAAATPLVGRVAELAEIRHLVLAQRLVTVTGAGGVGKTRLAQHVAADLVDRFPDGVWWVELAPISDSERVALAGAAAVDNCEHLVDAVAVLVRRLLDECPTVHVLATSREPLGVDGEYTWRAPSLDEADAIELFLERARQARSNFTMTEANAAAVAQICRRVAASPWPWS